MNVTPIRAAKLANARRVIAEILQDRNCLYAEEAARLVVDELRSLGWAPPGWTDDDVIPQPSTSSPAARRAALEAAAAAVTASREKRKKPKGAEA